jgi:hypothetical protein
MPAEDGELADLLDGIGWPDVVTLPMLIDRARDRQMNELAGSLGDRARSRLTATRMHEAGYDALPNPHAKGGLWSIGGRRMVVYMRSGITEADAHRAVGALRGAER